jgi:hypothetical protein
MSLAAPIDEEREKVIRDLGEALGRDDRGDELQLTGAEVLGFLAVKVVVPVVASFVSRELWERYNRMRTRSKAKEAEAELKGMVPAVPAVDEPDVVSAIVDSLRDEGVPGDVAERVALDAYARFANRLAQPGGPG